VSDKLPSAIVIPFGKHKGATVAELLEQDPAYAQWLLGQGWLAERFAELHAAIVARGAGTDDTPEHNAIQARFLDPVFRAAFLQSAHGDGLASQRQHVAAYSRERTSDWIERRRRELDAHRNRGTWYLKSYPNKAAEYAAEEQELIVKIEAAERAADTPILLALRTSVAFEQRGVDVALSWDFDSSEGELEHPDLHRPECIEIKPSLGDDFPSVMRQMARLRAGVLVVGSYTGRAVPFPDLRKMFAANGIKVLTVQEIEAEIADARALIRLQQV
jgi:hypothetical protein